ncbi:MAG: ABC transporter permease [Bacillota bacterium]
MFRYILKRLLMLIPVLIVMSFLIYGMIELIPGDPAQMLLGTHVTEEALEQAREEMGLNDPFLVRYGRFLRDIVQLDLGQSLMSRRPVWTMIGEKLPATIELSIFAMIFALGVGVTAGVVAAWNQNTIFDYLSSIVALIGISMPIYWLGFMLILFFAVNLNIFPTAGRLSAWVDSGSFETGFFLFESLFTGRWKVFFDAVRHMVLPAIALGTIPMAIVARMTRSALLEVLKQDYMRTARAKGLGFLNIFIHAIKNAAIPIVTVFGMQFGRFMGGAVLTESVFAWAGMGKWLLDGIYKRDFPVVIGGALTVAFLFVLVNLLTDLTYTLLDPRIKY